MDIVFQAGFDTYSGYGGDAVALALALERAGANVIPYPFSTLPGLPRDFTDLLTKDPRGHKDVQLVFAPPQALRSWELERLAERRVAYSMWERLPMVPDDFDGITAWHNQYGWPPDWQPRLEGWDAMVVTCPMNVDAFAPVVPDTTPIYVVPGGIEPSEWPLTPRQWFGDSFRFLVVGTSAPRKNVWTILEVWRDLQASDPTFHGHLHLHSLGPGFHPSLVEAYGPNLTMTNRALDHREMLAMYAACHVLISVSRGEGNNKPAMEFMATGGTVAATAWSGHMNWLWDDATYPLPGELVPAKGAPDAVEFEVDRDALAATILDAYRNRATAKRKGEVASATVRQALSWDHSAAAMLDVLRKTTYR